MSYVVTAAAVVTCAHTGKATPAPSPRVVVNGTPVITVATIYSIVGCQFPTMTSGAPPCVAGNFLVGSPRVFANGSPIIVTGNLSTSQPSQVPMINTTPIVQTRVLAM
jgi:hypothetical protein